MSQLLGPNFPQHHRTSSWDRPYRPPPHSTASWARSPARLGPFSVQHELAEATPKGAAREQHRTQLHDQLQHPASRTNLRSHLGKGQSAMASPGFGRRGRRIIQATSGPLLFLSVGKQSSRFLVPAGKTCSRRRRSAFPNSAYGELRAPLCTFKMGY